jgi:hypothetical protein
MYLHSCLYNRMCLHIGCYRSGYMFVWSVGTLGSAHLHQSDGHGGVLAKMRNNTSCHVSCVCSTVTLRRYSTSAIAASCRNTCRLETLTTQTAFCGTHVSYNSNSIRLMLIHALELSRYNSSH